MPETGPHFRADGKPVPSGDYEPKSRVDEYFSRQSVRYLLGQRSPHNRRYGIDRICSWPNDKTIRSFPSAAKWLTGCSRHSNCQRLCKNLARAHTCVVGLPDGKARAAEVAA